ncbi:MAG: helix-turn-helix domain-containing protein [Gemmatimonadota bacterium]
MSEAMTERIARRLKTRREAVGLSQDDLARRMKFNNRQTLTAIENGLRRTRPAELAAAAEILGVEPDFFTDRYSAAGEASFSFRAETSDETDLESFEFQAGRWIATYRELGAEEGRSTSFLAPSLSLSRRSSYEDAQLAADQVSQKLGLGRFPARELEVALEREWGILVLYVDLPEGISGAASRIEGLQAILINRNESPGRRNYDLAHELFHLLTWDVMVPPRIDIAKSSRDSMRVEQLADNFAAALLMPESTLRDWLNSGSQVPPLTEWIALKAQELGVSSPALRWRLHNLGYISKSDLSREEELPKESLRVRDKPQLFNASFVQRVYSAVESGMLSLRRASRLLGLDTVDFANLCKAYGRQLSYEV